MKGYPGPRASGMDRASLDQAERDAVMERAARRQAFMVRTHEAARKRTEAVDKR